MTRSTAAASLPPPQVVTYADDFTGATDSLATAARAGLRSLLFLRVPDDALRARAGTLDWLGIAGAARSMAPPAMAAELAPVAELFRRSGAQLLHYKTCSTFDSASHTGNIAVAIAALRPAVAQLWTALVGGQPGLGRYCAFGHLFAAAGNGGEVYRLDRHPTMSRHPVTPMHESDLRLHLAAQGLGDTALMPWTAYAQAEADVARLLARKLEPALTQAVLFDVLQTSDLAVVGRLLRNHAAQATLLAAGPSSVLQAWAGDVPAAPTPLPAASGPVLVLAGSLSPVTARQVEAAVSYEKFWINPVQLATDARYLEDSATAVTARLREGRSVLACTVEPGAPEQAGTSEVASRDIALAGGRLLARILAQAPLRRVGVAGGDTSSLGVQALDAWGLSYLATLSPGAALCRLHSDTPGLDGMEILLKGGQMGDTGLFEQLLHGRA
ncbi:MAG: four-carbon acid sugar kinase family protein [Pseudomonadota bacterium]